MNNDPKQDVAIFAEALHLPSSERPAFLERACGDDEGLRDRIEGLLRAYDSAGDFLNGPPPEVIESRAEISVGEKPGDRIGRYKLLRQIGEGGYGVVYLAEQEEAIHRLVGLKVIRPGMDTKAVMARFEAERQALALMDHPNIAKVFDAGATESGRPYFVMELVKGIKITDFCDQNSLTTEERLSLFVQVCRAVQHAHQKGIIHRDIKPSNILVSKQEDGSALPVVIDFGIAKATTNQRLSNATVFTSFEMLIGTPAYMSPEQAESGGVDVDTRTDIYSLGVLLYELLTGSTPFDSGELMKAGLDEIRRTIRERDPERPSTRLSTMAFPDLTSIARRRYSAPPNLIRSVRGDLDWIVMKALEKGRAQRYETANGLGMDIERHLRNEPVVARPPSRLYRFERMARRNKLVFGAAGAIVIALVLGAFMSTWQAVRATRAEKKEAQQRLVAQSAQKDSEAVTRYLSAVFQSPDPVRDGRTITVAESLDRASLSLNTDLAGQPARRAKLQEVIGRTYQALGLNRQAIPLLEQARNYYLSNFGLNNTNTLDAMANLAVSDFEAGRRDEALKLHASVLQLRRNVLGPEHPDTLTAMHHLAISYTFAGRNGEALKLCEHAFESRRRILGPEHPDTLKALNSVANCYANAGRGEEALKMREQALKIRRRVLGPQHPDTILSMDQLAFSYVLADRQEEALKLREEALELERKVFGLDHPRTLGTMVNLTDSYSRLGRHGEALKLGEEVFQSYSKVLGPEHPDTLLAMDNLAVFNHNAGHYDKALMLREQLLELMRKVFGPQHPDTIKTINKLADYQARGGNWSQAASNLSLSIALQPTEHTAYHLLAPLLVASEDLDGYREHCELVLARFAQTTDPGVAERMAKDCLILPGSTTNLAAVAGLADTAVTLGKSSSQISFYQFAKALAEYRQGKFASAADWANKAQPGVGFRDVQAYMVLAMAQCQLRHTEEARVALAKGIEIEQMKAPRTNSPDLGNDWGDWIIAHALTQEAKALLEGIPPPGPLDAKP